eukprot:TRINITY_DN14173_c0_g1_i1.p1 TRINITY_DN14173_c0_g1~~TRINITY_DN14173_c0_g1_i1.p1  ORF type:complete len:262 (-),score=44.23 TRINITY_DN14173_c0_g1_i1:41-826(-)
MKNKKNSIKIVVIGQKNAGKSTLAFHLLYQCGAVEKSKTEKLEHGKKEATWVMDVREGGHRCAVTIQNSLGTFRSPKREFTIIDAPGLKEVDKSIITRTSRADVAMLVISARKGESGLSKDGQTKEYTSQAHALGVKHLIVAVNKMDDDTVQYNEDRYLQIKNKVVSMLKTSSYNIKNVSFVPISGWAGENIAEETKKMPWWEGRTLLQTFEAIKFPTPFIPHPLQSVLLKPIELPIFLLRKSRQEFEQLQVHIQYAWNRS